MSMIGHSDSVVIHGGVFTQHVASASSQAAFEQLTKAVAPGAFHNSGERFDPPKCHPRTRLAVTERIMNWILGKESTDDLIMWFHGPAGCGKSAIAQRIAELCHATNQLLASFFCSISDPRRNSAKPIVPTIAYQIARAFPSARALIEQEIARDPLIFEQSFETQMLKLIVNPLQPLIDSDFFADPTSSPRLIILDGLDEVINRQEQTRILETISDIFRRNRVPFIFLIVSRPEQEISYTFNAQPLSGLTTRLILDDTFDPDEDIRIFLDDSFSEIKVNHPLKNSIPPSWPSSDSVSQLVHKSSGQFIYVSTVIRFMKSIRHRPVDRLDIVLGLRPVRLDLPFAELDALYVHILSSLENPHQTLQIIAAAIVQHFNDLSVSETEQLLGLELGDVDLYLADMTSLVSWDRVGYPPFRILHASFSDFLFDPSRSGAFTMDRKSMHTMMACHCLQHLIVASNSNLPEIYWVEKFPRYALAHAADHLSGSSPSPELMDLLQKLSFEDLIGSVHIYLATLVPKVLVEETKYFPQCIWETIFLFANALQVLGLHQLEYYNLRSRLCDQVVTKGLKSLNSPNSPLHFLLCLRIGASPRESLMIARQRWNDAACQLTDWDITNPLQEMLFHRAILPFTGWYTLKFRFMSDSIALREFLQDASRAGKFVVDAEAFADASLSCLQYLTRFRLGAPINIHHTRRNLSDRRNCPRLWNRRMKLIMRLPIFKDFNYNSFPSKKCYCVYYSSNMPDKVQLLRKQAEQRRTYLNATRLSLVFLCRALPRSAKSDDLVTFINAEKPFSQRALQFPAKLKKAKAAMATYLERVQQEYRAPSSNSEE